MSKNKKLSAGILAYRVRGDDLQVLLGHPGGPFWKNKDRNAWSIPKGLIDDGEDPLRAAQREFLEETGFTLDGPFLELAPIRQKSGKIVSAWACEADIDTNNIQSNSFPLEWPPKSGKIQEFPEIDKAEYFSIIEAIGKINQYQLDLIKDLCKQLEMEFPEIEPEQETPIQGTLL